jgi:hypothetical protein
MPATSIPLMFCRMTLDLAGWLVPEHARREWKREWTSELWHTWQLAGRPGEYSVTDAWRLYRRCLGSFADAWWHFTEADSAIAHLAEKMRSPTVCLVSLALLLTLWLCATGFLPTTRMVFRALVYSNGDRIALVSRTGRMSAVRGGIPEELAHEWVNNSRLVSELAICSLARKKEIALNGRRLDALSIAATPNLFDVLGLPLLSLPTNERRHSGVFLSHTFWEREFRGNSNVIGKTIEVNGRDERIAGVLPKPFWLLSPVVDLYELNDAAVPAQGMLVVRCKEDVTAAALESELQKAGEKNGYAFASTAPYAIFLRDAVFAPLWLFGAALFIGLLLAALAHGSRLMRFNEAGEWFPRQSWQWWSFFLVKTSMALLIVLVVGLELFVGMTRQTTSEALGGPALIWFYIVGCSGVLFASLADQRSRCRVCQRLLAFPIRIGCPGCLLLDWSGTEFLCPQGHGMLYVPHHVSCWEEEDRWILAEA